MSKIKCPQCGDRDVSITPYTPPDSDVASCWKCGYTSLADDFPKQDLFDQITASPEVLAEELVYQIFDVDGHEWWTSTLCNYTQWELRAEAIDATVAKLKEVCSE